MNKNYNNQEEKLLECLEYENTRYKEMLNSKETILGKKIYRNLEKLKKLQILSILNDWIKSKRIKRLRINEKKNTELVEYKREISGKKIVVYTCITGNYDNILEPNFKDYNCDYVLFSDNINRTTKIWDKKEIPEEIKEIKNNILINRYIKMHPFEFFKEYDYSIYVDGNVKIISDVNSFIPFANSKAGLALHRHSRRECLYKEADFCKIVGKGKKEKIDKEIRKIKQDNMPSNLGLLECNLIVTDLKNQNARKILEDWWNEFEESECYRDQIILPYVIWKDGFEMKDVGSLGNNIFENPKVRIEKH